MGRTNVSMWDTLKTRFPRWGASKRDISDAPAAAPRLQEAVDFGVAVTNQSALKNTALYAGIRLIAENIASLPKTINRYEGDDAKASQDHPSYKLINVRPNPYMTSFVFWNTMVTWLKGWGNAYAIILRNPNGSPKELHPVHPAGVRITQVKGHKWYKVQMQNTDLSYLNGLYADEDMIHVMELSLDGIKGVNPVVYNAMALGKSLATEKFAAEFYRKGGNIKAVMETDGHFGADEFKTFTEHLNSQMTNFGTPLLEYGVKYRQLSVDPVAAQLVQSEILSVQDVCRILNVPPHMIAELSHATFSNIEHQTIQFVQYSLRPIIKRIEMELENKLFFESETGQYDVKFILDGLLRGDTTARSAYYHNAILDGYMSRNEVRTLEGLEKAEGLDDYLYPSNENVVGQSENNTNEE